MKLTHSDVLCLMKGFSIWMITLLKMSIFYNDSARILPSFPLQQLLKLCHAVVQTVPLNRVKIYLQIFKEIACIARLCYLK